MTKPERPTIGSLKNQANMARNMSPFLKMAAAEAVILSLVDIVEEQEKRILKLERADHGSN